MSYTTTSTASNHNPFINAMDLGPGQTLTDNGAPAVDESGATMNRLSLD